MTDDDKADDAQPVSEVTLDDAFEVEDEEQEEVGAEPAKTPEPKAETKGEEQEDEPADEAEESEDETPSPEDKIEGKSVPVAALKSERSKRQAAEAERDELKKRLAPKDEDQGEPDVDTKLFAERTNMSREMMMELKTDYQEMETIFTDIAKDNPFLVSQMMKSHNPAKFAYEKAKEHVEIQQAKQLKDSEEYKEFLKAKALGKKTVKESPEAQRNKAVLSVPKLNKAASLASNSTPKENLETLDEMFAE